MLLATHSAGLLVALAEEAATAIGTGVVLGGFVAASSGVVNGRSRSEVEDTALRDGYFGAVTVLSIWLVSLCIVYAT
jgi:hypothetical protein